MMRLLIVGVLWAVVGVIFSRVARSRQDFAGFMAFSSLVTAACAWLFLPDHAVLLKEGWTFGVRASLVMLLAGLCSAAGFVAMNRGMRAGHHGATWTIGQSALVIPFLVGVLLFSDRVYVRNAIGVGAILTAIAVFGGKDETRTGAGNEASRWWLGLALLSLLCLGSNQTLTTLPSRWSGWEDTARLRVPMLCLGSALGYNILRGTWWRSWRTLAWRQAMLLSAVGVSSQVLLISAMDSFAASDRAALVYPVAVGTCITVFALYSVFVLREKATVKNILGMVLGCAGIILVSM